MILDFEIGEITDGGGSRVSGGDPETLKGYMNGQLWFPRERG